MIKKLKPKYLVLLLMIVLFVLSVNMEATGQCPMCKMAAESNLENGGTEGTALNTGILYMLAMPYLLVATLGFIWYRNKKLQEKETEEHS